MNFKYSSNENEVLNRERKRVRGVAKKGLRPGESDGHLQPVAKLTHEFCAGGNGPGDPQRLLDTASP